MSCRHPRYDIGPGPGAASITLSADRKSLTPEPEPWVGVEVNNLWTASEPGGRRGSREGRDEGTLSRGVEYSIAASECGLDPDTPGQENQHQPRSNC